MWRDGQARRVFVYRFMTTGTIEEKVFQRQLSKEGLQQVGLRFLCPQTMRAKRASRACERARRYLAQGLD